MGMFPWSKDETPLPKETVSENDPLCKSFTDLMDQLIREPGVMARTCFGPTFQAEYERIKSPFDSPEVWKRKEFEFIKVKHRQYEAWIDQTQKALQQRLDALARREELSKLSTKFQNDIVEMQLTVTTLGTTANRYWNDYFRRQGSPLTRPAVELVDRLQLQGQQLTTQAIAFKTSFVKTYKLFGRRAKF